MEQNRSVVLGIWKQCMHVGEERFCQTDEHSVSKVLILCRDSMATNLDMATTSFFCSRLDELRLRTSAPVIMHIQYLESGGGLLTKHKFVLRL